ncbi:MAG: hypothetical protein ABH952_07530 [Candidatus Omnitrophota bacterium]
MVMNMDYNGWKEYHTQKYIDTTKMTKEKFENKQKINLKKDYPDYRFMSVLYEVDYLFDGKEYSIIVDHIGPQKLEEFTFNRKSASGCLLIKENGKWKNHDFDLSQLSYDGFLDFADFDNLIRIVETGFVYKSKKHLGVLTFEPCDVLKTDSTE